MRRTRRAAAAAAAEDEAPAAAAEPIAAVAEHADEQDEPAAPLAAGEAFDPAALGSMKRRELQDLCKRFGIKANSKNVILVAELEAYHAAHFAMPPVADAAVGQEPEAMAEDEVEDMVEEAADEAADEVEEAADEAAAAPTEMEMMEEEVAADEEPTLHAEEAEEDEAASIATQPAVEAAPPAPLPEIAQPRRSTFVMHPRRSVLLGQAAAVAAAAAGGSASDSPAPRSAGRRKMWCESPKVTRLPSAVQLEVEAKPAIVPMRVAESSSESTTMPAQAAPPAAAAEIEVPATLPPPKPVEVTDEMKERMLAEINAKIAQKSGGTSPIGTVPTTAPTLSAAPPTLSNLARATKGAFNNKDKPVGRFDRAHAAAAKKSKSIVEDLEERRRRAELLSRNIPAVASLVQRKKVVSASAAAPPSASKANKERPSALKSRFAYDPRASIKKNGSIPWAKTSQHRKPLKSTDPNRQNFGKMTLKKTYSNERKAARNAQLSAHRTTADASV